MSGLYISFVRIYFCYYLKVQKVKFVNIYIKYSLVLVTILLITTCGNSNQSNTNQDDNKTENIQKNTINKITFIQDSSIIYYEKEAFLSLAEELQKLLFQSTNITIPISQYKQAGKKTISLLKLPKKYNIKKDGFVISSPNDTEIQIKGKNSVNISYGVYDMLEKNLGIKWLFPSEEGIGTHIPQYEEIVLKREERKEEPAFINRKFSAGIIARNESYKDWIKKMRMASSDIAFHHNLFKLFPPFKYHHSNPEYYPISKGVRYPLEEYIGSRDHLREGHSWQPVFTAKGIIKDAIKGINTFFSKNSSTNSYSLGMNDSNNWGDIQIQGKPNNSLGYPDMTDYFITWANTVVSNVLETNPNKYFGFLAYHGLADAPTTTMNHALIPFLTYDAMHRFDNERKLSNDRRILDWTEKADQIGIYDYIYGDQMIKGKAFYLIPRMHLSTMQEYYQFVNQHNVSHYYAEAYPHEEWTEGPKLYITTKLLWNPYIDIQKELDSWYKACVGSESAPYLARYYQFWKDFWKNRVAHSNWFKKNTNDYLNFHKTSYLKLLTKNDLAYLDDVMASMLANAKKEKFKKRAEFFYKGWNIVKDRAFSDEFMFINGTIPDGYSRIFIEDFEKNEDIPQEWNSWNRADTKAIIHEKHITTEDASSGKKSFKIAVTPNGIFEASTTIFKRFDNLIEKKYCVRVKTKSNASGYNILSGQYLDNNEQWHHLFYKLDSTHSNKFYTDATCFTITKNGDSATIRIFLMQTSTENQRFETFFDDIELFEYNSFATHNKGTL